MYVVRVPADEEETRAQRERRTAAAVPEDSREASITRNMLDALRPRGRHVALLGALHCRDASDWLHARLRARDALSEGESMSVRIVGERQEPSVAGFVSFLHQVGVRTGTFVVRDPEGLVSLERRWMGALTAAFAGYDAIIVLVDPRSEAGSGR